VPIVHSEAVEQPRPNGGKPAQGSKRQLQIRTLLRYGNSQQHLAEGATLRREVEKLRRPNRNQCSAKLYERLQIRVQLHGQEPKQQLADVPERRRDGNEVDQPNSIRTRQVSAKTNAHPCAVARTRTKTATGGCAKEASGRQRSRSAEQHQNAASQQNALHIRAQLHEEEPKQQLADVPERRQGGNELSQPKSVRARQGSRMQGENVPESRQEKKSLFLGFYSDPSALNRIRRSATRRTLTNSIISYLGSGEERAAHCMSEMAMYPHNMHGLSK